MRNFCFASAFVVILLAFDHTAYAPASAQETALVVIENEGNCAPTVPTSCRISLVNRSSSGRAVANIERRQVSTFPPMMYDRNLQRIFQGDTQFEVLLSAGDRVPLVAAVAVSEPPPGQGIYVRYEYRVLGSHPPTPDDVADAGSPNVADYFRLVAVKTPVFDGSDACRIGAIQHPANGLRMANFHPTKSVVITHRNTAPRYGSNPQWRVDYVPPGGVAPLPAVGCVTDIDPGYIQIQEVRFM